MTSKNWFSFLAQSAARRVGSNLEDLGEEDLERIRERYSELAVRARQRTQLGHKDTGTPTVEIVLPEGFAARCPRFGLMMFMD